MLSTVIVPLKTKVFISVPPSYIGKKVEVSLALKDETDEPKSTVRLSDLFRGVFSKDDAESFNKHTQTMRNEWPDI